MWKSNYIRILHSSRSLQIFTRTNCCCLRQYCITVCNYRRKISLYLDNEVPVHAYKWRSLLSVSRCLLRNWEIWEVLPCIALFFFLPLLHTHDYFWYLSSTLCIWIRWITCYQGCLRNERVISRFSKKKHLCKHRKALTLGKSLLFPIRKLF